MTKTEVITRLCDLSSQVGDKVFKNKEAHDCFCDLNPMAGFQFSEQVILFIEKAVKEAIEVEEALK